MEFKDYYRILGLQRDASQDEIKRAYRRLARKYHPDVSKESDAEDRFKEVSEAYEVLKDPEKRAAYDQLGRQRHAGEEFTPPPGWNAGFEFSGGGFTEADAGHFSEFFESLFGAGSPFGSAGPRRGGAGFAMRGDDHHARIQIDLEDAYHGAARALQLHIPDYDHNGRLIERSRTLNVKIPPGVREGQRIRLAGQGSPGTGSGPAGDLYLEVTFRPHPLFKVSAADIYLTLPVTPWEAALGTRIKVPTLGGAVELTIPKGTQTGARLRLKGRGLPGTPPGDQYVIVQVLTPKAETEAQADLYRKMAEEMPFDPRAHMDI